MDWLNGGSQGAEEARDEGEAQAAPGAEHGPAVAVADVVREAEQVPRETRKFEIDAGDAGAEGDDAEGAWTDRMKERSHQSPETAHTLTDA